ncbi:MAG: LecA/PA-IL family lectin [Humidesulfovibrio sp.]|uniref:LecA/PA-IL family lectin n=1 Tax=Humidesulfovibrio sp. TaxID=2910988 RepID=UPI0027362BEB|nr:LecA/PA-IL family lectin [Humidesulfovibrio sp.]MDP2849161.1 LecA/PA-IL family lectin [Humidesulfovibrio sp.]
MRHSPVFRLNAFRFELGGHLLSRLAMLFLLALVLCACAGAKYTDQPTMAVDLTQGEMRGQVAGTRVLAKADEWRNSGVLVRKGGAYSITAAGRWNVWGTCPWTDADGLNMYGPLCIDWGNAYLKGWSHAALIAKIGENGTAFGVGKSLRFTAADDGLLYFIINDTPGHFWDNNGYVDVNISLVGGGALAQSPAPPGPSVPPAPIQAKKKASAALPSATAVPIPAPAPPPVFVEQAAPEPAPPEPAPLPQVVSQPPPQAQPMAQPFGRRTALVIGNGAYPSAPLRNPVNDARDMASVLRSLGFEVIVRENATLRQMEDAVDELWKRLRNGGAGLFFFAGHGLQVAGRNYLVPVDARLTVEQDVKYRCMDAGLVLGRMENAGNGLNIVILDACRNNPYARSFRSTTEGLAKMDAPKGSLVAYATAPDSIAADGTGKNGIYTGELLKNLRTPGISVEELFKRVRVGVLRETGEKQVPWESSSLTGYFMFNAGGR